MGMVELGRCGCGGVVFWPGYCVRGPSAIVGLLERHHGYTTRSIVYTKLCTRILPVSGMGSYYKDLCKLNSFAMISGGPAVPNHIVTFIPGNDVDESGTVPDGVQNG